MRVRVLAGAHARDDVVRVLAGGRAAMPRNAIAIDAHDASAVGGSAVQGRAL